MNNRKIIGLSALLITLLSTNCFASTTQIKEYEINKTIPINIAQQYKENVEKEITIDNIKYKIQEIQEKENRKTETVDKEQIQEKLVHTDNKYDVLNMFEDKIEITEDGMSGILELENDSLNLQINDSYKEQYKATLKREYKNVPQNELNNIPKTIKQDGIVYYLVNPIWNISKTQKIEGQDIPISYNGEMYYEGIKERTIIKSYIASAKYKGKLKKEEVASVTFNIKYKELPKEETKSYVPMAIATASTSVIVVSGIILWKRKKKKEK